LPIISLVDVFHSGGLVFFVFWKLLIIPDIECVIPTEFYCAMFHGKNYFTPPIGGLENVLSLQY